MSSRRGVVGEGVAVGQLGHETVAVGRDAVHPVPGAGEGVEQVDHAGRSVEGHGVAQAAALGGVRRQHHRHPPLGGRDPSQGGQAHGQPGDPRHPVGSCPVGRDRCAQLVTVVHGLLEREGNAHDAAVELGDGHRHGHVHGRQAGVARLPPRRGLGGRHCLDDRHVEGGERTRVPLVAGARAHGQHGRDEAVHAPLDQQVQGGHSSGGVGPQGVAVHGHRVGAPFLHGRRQVVDELCVPGQHVGPVEHDADGGRPGHRGALQYADGRDLHRRVEPEPSEEDGVGHEAQQVLGVGQPAVKEVLEGLGHGGAGHGGRRGELGVGGGLAAEGQQRDARPDAPAAQLVEGLPPGLAPAEQADQHGVGAIDPGGVVEVGGVGRPHVGKAGRQSLEH